LSKVRYFLPWLRLRRSFTTVRTGCFFVKFCAALGRKWRAELRYFHNYRYMKKILIAYDGTPGAGIALSDLRWAGLPNRAEARVLTIADVWVPPKARPDDLAAAPLSQLAYEKAAEVVRTSKKIAIEGARKTHELFPEWSVTNSARAESPAWGIVAEAKRWDADLIVIGSHGRTLLERFFLGSVSFKVAAEAHCSVRIVRPYSGSASDPHRIFAALDGSGDSSKMLDELVSRDWRSGVKVELVSVIDEKLKSTWIGRSDLQITDTVEEALEGLHKSALAKLTVRNIPSEFHLVEGDPKSTLLRLASEWKVDSIFLGARGLDHGNRLYLGTLASAICTRAHCTVEIVR
jgi:nucleotide-binding universal stress UspA family protein